MTSSSPRRRRASPSRVTKASKRVLKDVDTTADVTPAAAEKQALGAAPRPRAPRRPRPTARPQGGLGGRRARRSSRTRPSSAASSTTARPNELHVVTDATTGEKISEWQAVENGTGNTQYSGQVTLGSTQSGTTYNLTDAARGNHKTYNLNRGTSGTGTLFSGPDDVWGNGAASNLETAGADAALRRRESRGTTTRTSTAATASRRRRRPRTAGSTTATTTSTRSGTDSCFCMTYGDGAGNAKPLTSIDVAAHEMTHGVTARQPAWSTAVSPAASTRPPRDIFGTAVEFYANNAADPGDYLVGEKIDISGNGTPLRYMDKPSKDGASKDSWYSGIGSVDVHYSSGLANHFFYLLSEGSGAKTVNGVTLRLPDLGRPARDRHRPGQGREDLVPGALHEVHQHDELRGGPHRHARGRRRPVRHHERRVHGRPDAWAGVASVPARAPTRPPRARSSSPTPSSRSRTTAPLSPRRSTSPVSRATPRPPSWWT